MVKCYNCSSRTKLHSMPRTPKILAIWKKVIPNGKRANFDKLFKLCSDHFCENLLTNTGKLFWNAIPTKFRNRQGKWYSVEVENIDTKDESDPEEEDKDKDINLPGSEGLHETIFKTEKEDLSVSLKCNNCSSIRPLLSLPLSEKVLEMWMKVIPNKPVFDASFRLCVEHFAVDCFDKISGKLFWNAIPTRFKNDADFWYRISDREMEKIYSTLSIREEIFLPQTNGALKSYKNKRQLSGDQDASGGIKPFMVKKKSHTCFQCKSEIEDSDKILYWQTQKFCNESCLEEFQKSISSICPTCNNSVPLHNLGKFITRFDSDIKQFCRGLCVILYKKGWKKVCSYCQCVLTDVKHNDYSERDNFCSQECFENLTVPVKLIKCYVCNEEKVSSSKLLLNKNCLEFCREHCLTAYKFGNEIATEQCAICTKYFKQQNEQFTIYEYDTPPILFCSKICMNIFIMNNRYGVHCSNCNIKKYNYDMVQKKSENKMILLCSLNCIEVNDSNVANNSLAVRDPCHSCKKIAKSLFNLTKTNGIVLKFCSYPCVFDFQLDARNRVKITSKAPRTPSPSILIEKEQEEQNMSSLETTCVESNEITTEVDPLSVHTTNVTSTDNEILPAVNTSSQQSPTNAHNESQIPEGYIKVYPVENKQPLQNTLHVMLKTGSSESECSPLLETELDFIRILPDVKPPFSLANKAMIRMLFRDLRASRPELKTQECQTDECQTGECQTDECQTDECVPEKIYVPVPVPVEVQVPVIVPLPIPLPIPVPIFIKIETLPPDTTEQVATENKVSEKREITESSSLNIKAKKPKNVNNFNECFYNFAMSHKNYFETFQKITE